MTDCEPEADGEEVNGGGNDLDTGAVKRDRVSAANLLLNVIQDDIRHVHVRVTAAMGIAAVFVTQIPLKELRGQPDRYRVLTVLGIGLLAFSAVFYFQYTQELNKLRLRIAADVSGAAGGSAAQEWTTQFKGRSSWRSRNLWWYRFGQWLFLLGSSCVAVVLIRLIVVDI